jgi:glycosyltransferase involved in cell wall biosynthesis
LLLIGDTKGADWCRALIDDLGVGDSVKLCGDVSHQDFLQLLERSAAFLRPTLYDGDSLSVREAIALGLPVVATATDFRPAGTVQYQRDEPGDLTAKMLQVLQSRSPARHEITQAQRREERDENFEQVYGVYREVTSA